MIYSLERGLEKLRVSSTNESYLELVNKELNGTVRTLFWKNVAGILDKEIRAAIKGVFSKVSELITKDPLFFNKLFKQNTRDFFGSFMTF